MKWSLTLILRIAILISTAAYGAFAFVSRASVFDPGLEAPLAFGGWLVLASLIVAAGVPTRRWKASLPKGVLRPLPLTLAFLAVALTALALAVTSNTPVDCPPTARSCIKIDEWKQSEGHYYRLYPYDVQGNSDRSQPWVEISRATYLAEVGARLRSAAAFGIGALCLAWFVVPAAVRTGSERASVRQPHRERTDN
ncbi:MAG: hypothetical protein NVS1B6_14360 [Steroidobacteraceae bacterium]